MACRVKTDISNRADITVIIEVFYADVRKDALLGRIFDEVAKVNWVEHTPLIIDFWEFTVLGTGEYKRNVMTPHYQLHEKEPMQKEHFDRWLQLFTATVDRLYRGPRADLMKTRAFGVAGLMQHKLGIGQEKF